jgi:hypothetical protein
MRIFIDPTSRMLASSASRVHVERDRDASISCKAHATE